MRAAERELAKHVPYYNTMKRAGIGQQQKKSTGSRKKHTTLTEMCESRQKAILKPHVTANQAAKKLYDYEATGLSPYEVQNLIQQVQGLTARVKKLEDWEE